MYFFRKQNREACPLTWHQQLLVHNPASHGDHHQQRLQIHPGAGLDNHHQLHDKFTGADSAHRQHQHSYPGAVDDNCHQLPERNDLNLTIDIKQ